MYASIQRSRRHRLRHTAYRRSWKGLHAYAYARAHIGISAYRRSRRGAPPFAYAHALQKHMHAPVQVHSASARSTAVTTGPAAAAARAVAKLNAEGIRVPVVTGGGTGTAAMDIAAGRHTELQPGAYLLMDSKYTRNEACPFTQARSHSTHIALT